MGRRLLRWALANAAEEIRKELQKHDIEQMADKLLQEMNRK